MNCCKQKIRLNLLGDVRFGSKLDDIIRKKGREKLVLQLWQRGDQADITIINLEGPLTNIALPTTTRRTSLRSSPTAIKVLSPDIVIGLANNHIFDYGLQGFDDTVSRLQENGISYGGAGENIEIAKRPVELEVHGQRLGILFAADPRYDPASSHSPGTFPATPKLLIESVSRLRQKVDWLIVSLHIGFEYTSIPTPYMRSLVECCVKEGADVIYFHHAHRYSGITREKTGTVIWGGGNYVFRESKHRRVTAMLGGVKWQLTLAEGSEGKEIVTNPCPVSFDENGFPIAPSPRVNRAIHKRIKRFSKRIKNRKSLLLWSVATLFNPFFLRSSLPNYIYILRREGLSQLLARVLSSINLYWRKNY